MPRQYIYQVEMFSFTNDKNWCRTFGYYSSKRRAVQVANKRFKTEKDVTIVCVNAIEINKDIEGYSVEMGIWSKKDPVLSAKAQEAFRKEMEPFHCAGVS